MPRKNRPAAKSQSSHETKSASGARIAYQGELGANSHELRDAYRDTAGFVSLGVLNAPFGVSFQTSGPPTPESGWKGTGVEIIELEPDRRWGMTTTQICARGSS